MILLQLAWKLILKWSLALHVLSGEVDGGSAAVACETKAAGGAGILVHILHPVDCQTLDRLALLITSQTGEITKLFAN